MEYVDYKITESIEVEGRVLCSVEVPGRGVLLIDFPAEHEFDSEAIISRTIVERLRLDDSK